MKVGTDGVLLGAWATGGSRILDVGTGTGIIALMLAQRCPQAHVTAIDIDEGAVRQALHNVAQSSFSDRVEVLQETVQEHAGNAGRSRNAGKNVNYDAIVSNPPFFIDSLQAPDRQRNMARHAETLTYAQLMQAIVGAWRMRRLSWVFSLVGCVPSARQRTSLSNVSCWLSGSILVPVNAPK